MYIPPLTILDFTLLMELSKILAIRCEKLKESS